MSILKAPPRQPKNAALQLRIDHELKIKLEKYAEFLDSTESYVVSEALRLVFNKDVEFKVWLERNEANGSEPSAEQASVPTKKDKRTTAFTSSASKANGNELFK
jgi:predicted transcriptional regulator